VLTPIPDLPATVIGVVAHDKITAEDYETVLAPAVEAAESASSDGKLRMLFVFGPEFPHFTAGAAWDDAKLSLGKFRHWERVAIVGDADWLHRAIHALSWAMPGDVRAFASGELQEARAWVSLDG
jgi:SpoIIAA-like